jgi:dCTP deaminase
VVFEGDRGLAKKRVRPNKKRTTIRRIGVLTAGEIEARLKVDLDNPHSLVITPVPRKKEDRDRDSVDLRLGNCFFVPRAYRSPSFIPGVSDTQHLYSEQYIPYGSYLVLPAHHTVLGSTLEYIKLPSDVSGQVLTKSSWARTFITIETAPWIHPLYRGCLTLEIANVSNTPIVLYPGIKVAQLVLLGTTRDTAKDKDDSIEGTYIGPVRPEPGELKRPYEAISYLGVQRKDMRYPFDECFKHEELRERAADHLRQYNYDVAVPHDGTL